jgi:hypothetical protein
VGVTLRDRGGARSGGSLASVLGVDMLAAGEIGLYTGADLMDDGYMYKF